MDQVESPSALIPVLFKLILTARSDTLIMLSQYFERGHANFAGCFRYGTMLLARKPAQEPMLKGMDQQQPNTWPARFSHQSLTVEIVEDGESFRSLADKWEDLTARSSCTVFQTFDWQYLWWTHFSSTTMHRPHIILFKDGSKFVGIAPFFMETHSIFGMTIHVHLRLIGSGITSARSPVLSMDRVGPSDYLDVIALPGYEHSVSSVLAAYLMKTTQLWDEIDLQNIPEGSILLNKVVPQLRDGGVPISTSDSDVCPNIALPPTADDFFATLNQRTRRSLRRARKTYIESRNFQLIEVTGGSEIISAVQTLAALHQQRWNALGYPGLFSDKRFESMQFDLAQSIAAKGRLRIFVLKDGDRPVSARLVFTFKDRVYDYLSGTDTRKEHDGSSGYSGSGVALLITAIQRMIEEGYRVFDLLRGAEEYKFDLANWAAKNYRVRIFGARSDNANILRSVYRFKSGARSALSRIRCESTIFFTIAGRDGYALALPHYFSHLRKRISDRRALVSHALTGESHPEIPAKELVAIDGRENAGDIDA